MTRCVRTWNQIVHSLAILYNQLSALFCCIAPKLWLAPRIALVRGMRNSSYFCMARSNCFRVNLISSTRPFSSIVINWLIVIQCITGLFPNKSSEATKPRRPHLQRPSWHPKIQDWISKQLKNAMNAYLADIGYRRMRSITKHDNPTIDPLFQWLSCTQTNTNNTFSTQKRFNKFRIPSIVSMQWRGEGDQIDYLSFLDRVKHSFFASSGLKLPHDSGFSSVGKNSYHVSTYIRRLGQDLLGTLARFPRWGSNKRDTLTWPSWESKYHETAVLSSKRPLSIYRNEEFI